MKMKTIGINVDKQNNSKKEEMNTTPGIIFEKDKKTGKRYVRVDIEQYQMEITPFLEKIGALDLNDDFDKAWVSAMSGTQLRERLYQKIDAWEWEQKNKK
jgi:hypothetical protein